MNNSFYENYGLSKDTDFIKGLECQDLNGHYQKSGVPLKYENNSVYTDNSDSHTLIFGNTGSKKTRNFCIPTVYTMGMAGESMVISDPKGEIYRYTSGYLKEQGYSIRVFNLRNPEHGSKWNPLMLPYRYYKNGDQDKAIELISDFCMQVKNQVHDENDLFWENQAMDLLMGLILILFEVESDENKIHMESVQRIRIHIGVESDSSDYSSNVFWKMLDTFPERSLIRLKLASVSNLRRVEKTLNCVISTFDSMVRSFLLNKKLMSMMDSSEFDFETIAKEKTALYLITPDEKTTFHFLVSVFVKQCYEVFIDYAQKCPGGVLPIRINYILDEFSNFPQIADMPAMISAARSRNIRFVLVVQSKQQLESGYGQSSETIKSNCKTWIYLTCRELSLLREISELCGTIDINDRERPVLSITQLQQLIIGWEDSQALIMRSGISPYLTWVKDFVVYPQAKYPSIKFEQHEIKPTKCFSAPRYMYNFLKAELESGKKV